MVAAGDQAIPPDAERQFAQRMGATTVEVDAGHLAMVSHAADVVALIETAAQAVGSGPGWRMRTKLRVCRPDAHGKRPDLIVHEEAPFNAEAPLAALAEGPLTATDAFYVRDHGPVPEIDPPRGACAWRGWSSAS